MTLLRHAPSSVSPPPGSAGTGAPGAAFGIAIALAAATVAMTVHHAVGALSAHVVAVLLGIAVGNSPLAQRATPGLRTAGRRLLRVGIVLLGLRISVGDVVALGPALLLAVVAVVACTFTSTRWLGARLGLSPGFSLLVATGWSICGASAIAAAEPLAGADEEEVAYAVALVALCGSLAIAVLPAIDLLLDLGGPVFGSWVGASVHDVGQVVATASTHGDDAVAAAVVVKLTRVALLAPLLATVALTVRRRGGAGAAVDTRASHRPALVPGFVVAFLAAVALRSSGVVPPSVLRGASGLETFLVAAGLAGLGGQVVWRRLRRLGGRPLVLGLASWALVAGVALPAVMLTT